MAEVMFATGCRSGEAFDLDARRDLSMEYGTVTFRDTKNGSERTNQLLPRTMTALAQLPNLKKPGKLFRKTGGAEYEPRKFNSGAQLIFLRMAAKRVGVDFNPHMTRHSFATWFYSQTKDTYRLRVSGGWRTASQVERYAHVAPAQVGIDAATLGWDFREKIGNSLESEIQTSRRA